MVTVRLLFGENHRLGLASCQRKLTEIEDDPFVSGLSQSLPKSGVKVAYRSSSTSNVQRNDPLISTSLRRLMRFRNERARLMVRPSAPGLFQGNTVISASAPARRCRRKLEADARRRRRQHQHRLWQAFAKSRETLYTKSAARGKGRADTARWSPSIRQAAREEILAQTSFRTRT